MVWWTWILLWVALAALALLAFGVLGWRLFRGFTALMAEMGRAGEVIAPSPDVHRPVKERQYAPAILRSPAAVRADNAANARLRRWARLERRVRRKSLRDQPQRLRDMPHL